ncbi:MAG: hypothetical protein M1358_05555 [Chloroflexi bacterium]|nr:hypothetical protein [Chloroflexota bacterium]
MKLDDFVGRKRDKRWGTMRYVRSRRDILSKERAGQLDQVAAEKAREERDLVTTLDRRQRLIKELRKADLRAIVSEIRSVRDLPKLNYHFESHGEDLGVATKEDYVVRLREHLSRTDLEFYAHLRKQDDIMWFAVHLDSQEVAQYNASKKSLWSFYKDRDFGAFLARGKLVRIALVDGQWRVKT